MQNMGEESNVIPFVKAEKHKKSLLEKTVKEIEDPLNAASVSLFDKLDFIDDKMELDLERDSLIVLNENDFLIDGSDEEIDFLVSRKKIKLTALLANGDLNNLSTFSKDPELPLVRNIEVLLCGDIGIRRKSELSELGIAVISDQIALDGRWLPVSTKSKNATRASEVWHWPEREIYMETVLSVQRLSCTTGESSKRLSFSRQSGKHE